MAANGDVTPGRWIKSGWRIFKEDIGNFILITLVFIALTLIGNIVVAGPLLAGMFYAARRRMLEGRTDLTDLFTGFNHFIDTFLVFILTLVFLNVGLVLCVFPALIVAAFYLFSFLFLIDRKLSFWDAMESSRKHIVKNLVGYILFALLLILFNILGLILAGVGLLITIPVSIAAITAAYQEQVGLASPPPPSPGPVVIP